MAVATDVVSEEDMAAARDFIDLREHLEMRIDELEKRVDGRFLAIEKRIDERFEALERSRGLAFAELSRRLEDLNRLRDEVMSDRSQFVLRSTYDDRQEALFRRLSMLEKKQAWMMGVGSVLIAVVGMAAALLGALVEYLRN